MFQLPLIYFILIKYVIACSFTVVARESITAVAWDSAGAPIQARSYKRLAIRLLIIPSSHVGFDGKQMLTLALCVGLMKTDGPCHGAVLFSICIGLSRTVGPPEGLRILPAMP